jgi:hypothetical protein
MKMFCPKCKCEYREGFNYCTKCEMELVQELPNEEFQRDVVEYLELVTIAETTDICIIPIVKSILDYGGIKYFIKGYMSRNFTSFNNIMEIQVPVENVKDALDLLKDLDIK